MCLLSLISRFWELFHDRLFFLRVPVPGSNTAVKVRQGRFVNLLHLGWRCVTYTKVGIGYGDTFFSKYSLSNKSAFVFIPISNLSYLTFIIAFECRSFFFWVCFVCFGTCARMKLKWKRVKWQYTWLCFSRLRLISIDEQTISALLETFC